MDRNANPFADFHPAGWFFQEYSRSRGSNFDPHIDHAWVWGPRILDLNLLTTCTLSFFKELELEVELPKFPKDKECAADGDGDAPPKTQLRLRVDVVLPPRSLLLFEGDTRYVWKHAVLEDACDYDAGDDEGRRLSLTLRELAPELLSSTPGKPEGIGSEGANDEKGTFNEQALEKLQQRAETCRQLLQQFRF